MPRAPGQEYLRASRLLAIAFRNMQRTARAPTKEECESASTPFDARDACETCLVWMPAVEGGTAAPDLSQVGSSARALQPVSRCPRWQASVLGHSAAVPVVPEARVPRTAANPFFGRRRDAAGIRSCGPSIHKRTTSAEVFCDAGWRWIGGTRVCEAEERSMRPDWLGPCAP